MTDEPRDLMAWLKSSLGIPQKLPSNLNEILAELPPAHQSPTPRTDGTIRALCAEVQHLREGGIRYDDAIERLRGDWAGERDKVLALQARIDAALATVDVWAQNADARSIVEYTRGECARIVRAALTGEAS